MGKLADKVALITGATSGIGLASARRFAAEGAHVFITGRRREQLDQAVAAIGRNVTAVSGDAGNLADLDRLYSIVSAQQGHLDIVFANAGTGEFAALGAITEEHFDKTVALNMRGVLFTVQKALPLMRDGGSILITGSIASVKGFPAFGIYNATKAAVRSFARTWANELKDRNIRVNVLSPGPVETGIFEHLPDGARDQFAAMIPRGTIGHPDEIASAALFLASSDASFVNGVELFADGGTAQI